jgi:hypothetical protein
MESPRSIFGATLPAPAPDELAGLLRASAYLRRAGTAAASHLLAAATVSPRDIALCDLRDSLHAAASLCDGMADLFAEDAERPSRGGSLNG